MIFIKILVELLCHLFDGSCMIWLSVFFIANYWSISIPTHAMELVFWILASATKGTKNGRPLCIVSCAKGLSNSHSTRSILINPISGCLAICTRERIKNRVLSELSFLRLLKSLFIECWICCQLPNCTAVFFKGLCWHASVPL